MPKYITDIIEHTQIPFSTSEEILNRFRLTIFTNIIWHLQFLLCPAFIWTPFVQRKFLDEENFNISAQVSQKLSNKLKNGTELEAKQKKSFRSINEFLDDSASEV